MNISEIVEKPTPEQIKQARLNAGLTQKEAAEVIDVQRYQSWQEWERGATGMLGYAWELFLLKTDQHPVYRLTKKRGVK